MNDLSSRIKFLRREKGLTQAELANRLNITDKAISKWEVGEASPNIELLVELASILGVSVDYLLTGKRKEQETTIMSKMEFCCKNDDVESFKTLKSFTDESGISVLDYVEKYDAKKVLAEYMARKAIAADPNDNFAEEIRAVKLALKYDLLDSLKMFGALEYMTDDDRRIKRSLYYKNLNQIVPSSEKESETYRQDYGNRKIVFDIWPSKNILDYYFEFRSLDKKIKSLKDKNPSFRRSHFYDVDYTGVFLDFLTMAIDQKNSEKIKVIWDYVRKYQGIELKEYEEEKIRAKNLNQQNFWEHVTVGNLHYKPSVKTKDIFKVVSLSQTQIIELLKLGLFDIAREANEFAHAKTDWSLSDWKECKVEENQFTKYRILAKNPNIDTRLLDDSIDGVVILNRLLQEDDASFIVNTLKKEPIYECEKLYNLYKADDKKAIFKFAVDNNLLKLAESCFNDNFEYEILKTISAIATEIQGSPCRGFVHEKVDVYELINIDNKNGYCFLNRDDSGHLSKKVMRSTSREKYFEDLSLGAIKRLVDDLFSTLFEYKREIIGQYSAKAEMQKLIATTYTKDFFSKEIKEDKIEDCVIKLCTLFELKLKADGKNGNFAKMINDYCEKFYSYDDEYPCCFDDHKVDILNRLRLMRNNYLHVCSENFSPLSKAELKECVDEICGWEIE